MLSFYEKMLVIQEILGCNSDAEMSEEWVVFVYLKFLALCFEILHILAQKVYFVDQNIVGF